MRWLTCVIGLCLATFPAFCQSTSKYQLATITEVKQHQAARDGAPGVTSYDVSVKVGDTIYVALYKPEFSENTVKYAVGRQLLVLVGKSAISYRDISGRLFEVPIESQRPATAAKPKT